jgi:GNAT superfamily N-acetyltransferase
MIKLRPGTEEDHAFILSSWLKAYFDCGNHYYRPPKKIFFEKHADKVKEHLAGHVIVATTEEDPSQIIGYAVHSSGVLHFVYVKSLFRKMGVARELIRKASCKQYSQHTTGSKFINKHMEYNPYAF